MSSAMGQKAATLCACDTPAHASTADIETLIFFETISSSDTDALPILKAARPFDQELLHNQIVSRMEIGVH